MDWHVVLGFALMAVIGLIGGCVGFVAMRRRVFKKVVAGFVAGLGVFGVLASVSIIPLMPTGMAVFVNMFIFLFGVLGGAFLAKEY